MILDEEQLDFLEKELGITKDFIEKASKEQWKDVREKCFYIEADELLALEDSDSDEETERCILATSIADIKYSMLRKSLTSQDEQE
jgi:hypothetical protein